jgi:hypothetical protein
MSKIERLFVELGIGSVPQADVSVLELNREKLASFRNVNTLKIGNLQNLFMDSFHHASYNGNYTLSGAALQLILAARTRTIGRTSSKNL